MLIIGAKGFAKEVLEVIFQIDPARTLCFYDDVNQDLPEKLFGKYPIYRTAEEVIACFQNDPSFTIGIGNPVLRQKLFIKFKNLGGIYTSVISPRATIGNFDNIVGDGCNIMSGVVITSSITLGSGCLINLNSTIGHDCIIGNFVEMSPNVNISGNCTIGDFTNFGTNATVLPKLTIGKNVIIGAGSVVTKDLPDNVLAYGIPAKIIRTLESVTE